MTLLTNWRAILRHAWSVRFMALAVMFEILSQVLPFFEKALPVSAEVLGLIELSLLLAALAARFINQKSLSPRP